MLSWVTLSDNSGPSHHLMTTAWEMPSNSLTAEPSQLIQSLVISYCFELLGFGNILLCSNKNPYISPSTLFFFLLQLFLTSVCFLVVSVPQYISILIQWCSLHLQMLPVSKPLTDHITLHESSTNTNIIIGCMISEQTILRCVPYPSCASMFSELHAQTLFPDFSILCPFSLLLIILILYVFK